MNRIDFKNIEPSSKKENKELNKEDLFIDPDGISIKNIYSKSDLDTIKHLDFFPGIPPYIRGPYASMYTQRPWTIRQYAGFSTAKESNLFTKKI